MPARDPLVMDQCGCADGAEAIGADLPERKLDFGGIGFGIIPIHDDDALVEVGEDFGLLVENEVAPDDELLVVIGGERVEGVEIFRPDLRARFGLKRLARQCGAAPVDFIATGVEVSGWKYTGQLTV